MKDRIRVKSYTRVEGGTIQDAEFEMFEDEMDKWHTVEKKEVFCKAIGRKITTRVVKIGKIYVHALFFENGNIYHAHTHGFKKREIMEEAI